MQQARGARLTKHGPTPGKGQGRNEPRTMDNLHENPAGVEAAPLAALDASDAWTDPRTLALVGVLRRHEAKVADIKRRIAAADRAAAQARRRRTPAQARRRTDPNAATRERLRRVAVRDADAEIERAEIESAKLEPAVKLAAQTSTLPIEVFARSYVEMQRAAAPPARLAPRVARIEPRVVRLAPRARVRAPRRARRTAVRLAAVASGAEPPSSDDPAPCSSGRPLAAGRLS
jgi:hypothetical protein